MTKLFDDFDPVSAQAWKQKIQMDLKGADYNDTLIWHTREGIDVKPFYHRDDREDSFPHIESNATNFRIQKDIFVANAQKSNEEAKKAIQEGVESISFYVPESTDLTVLLSDLIDIPIHLSFETLNDAFINQLASLSNQKNLYLHVDIIGHLARTGNWMHNLKEDHRLMESLVEKSGDFNSSLSIDMTLFQNAGATMIQQLAYGLAQAAEYLNHFDKGNIRNNLVFKVAVGSNYFFEIAKIRAVRLLWNAVADTFGINQNCVIVAMPSKRNKTLYDYNTNMLRTTTESMSAVLGGADFVQNMAYDAVYHKENEFGNRISKNQLLILKHESYFDLVDNPADGAYYIENLTNLLAEKALDLFKDIESNGGLLAQLKEGTIQRKIKEAATKEQASFDSGNYVLLGTNKHPNDEDKMKDDLELYPFLKIDKRKTLIEPILEKRLAEKIEQERLNKEQ